MATQVYSMMVEDLQVQANQVKEYLIEHLAREGYLTEEQVKQILDTYAIIIVRKGWLGRMLNVMFRANATDETIEYRFVKVLR